jgi:hypothetical protein
MALAIHGVMSTTKEAGNGMGSDSFASQILDPTSSPLHALANRSKPQGEPATGSAEFILRMASPLK